MSLKESRSLMHPPPPPPPVANSFAPRGGYGATTVTVLAPPANSPSTGDCTSADTQYSGRGDGVPAAANTTTHDQNYLLPALSPHPTTGYIRL